MVAAGRVEQRLQPVGEANRGVDPALAPARTVRVGRLLPRPFAIGGERAALERAEVDLVEERLDRERRPASLECDSERLLRAREPRADPEIDRLGRESQAERARLFDTSGREALARRDGVDRVAGVGDGVRVTRQDQGLHRRTER